MTTRELCILEDELQTLWDDTRTAEKAYNRYCDISKEDFNAEHAEELRQEWVDAYSKYAFLYTLYEKLGLGVNAPNNRFKLRK